MKSLGLALSVVAAIALMAGLAEAKPTTLPKPQAGVWKFGDADGGFSLASGQSGKLFLTNIHSRTQNFVGCPENPERITVSGRFSLKVEKLEKIYPVWAVGRPGTETRYSDGNSGLISIPAQVKVDGKKVPGGGIKMEFSYEEPTVFSLLIIEFGPKDGSPCITYAESATHG